MSSQQTTRRASDSRELPKSFGLEPQSRLSERSPYLLRSPDSLCDVPIHLLLVVMVVRQRGVDLRQGERRMLPLDLLRIPVVSDSIGRTRGRGSTDLDCVGLCKR